MRIFIFWLGLCALICSSCGPRQAGNTMETENSMAFTLVLPNGKPAVGAAYTLRPYWQLEQTLLLDDLDMYQQGFADKKGQVAFKNLPQGKYKLTFIQDSLAISLAVDYFDTASLNQQVNLVPSGSIQGRVTGDFTHARVILNGLHLSAPVDSTGAFHITPIPVGEHIVSVVDLKNQSVLAEALCSVQASQLTDLQLMLPANPQDENTDLWRYSREFFPSELLTSWMRPLTFPTVAKIYLTPQNFDFSQSLSQGQDLRLASSDGKILPYHLRYFDANQDFAVLTVRFDSPADTAWPLVLRWGKSFSAPPPAADVWAGLPDSLILALNSLLIDDFEAGTNHNAIRHQGQNNFWFVSSPNPDIHFIQPQPERNFSTAIKTDSLRSSKALHLQYQVNSPEWLMVGTNFGNAEYNLSALDSLVFWVRGNTEYSVAFEANNQASLGHKAWIHLEAKDSWQKIILTSNDFLPGDSIGGNLGWDAIKHSITNLSIFVSGEGELWLDNLRFYGVSPADFP